MLSLPVWLVLQAQAADLRQEVRSATEAAQSSQHDYTQLEERLESTQQQRTQLQEQLHVAQALVSQLQQQLHQTQAQSSQHQQELHHVGQPKIFELESQLSEATARNQTTAGELASSEAARSEHREQGTGLQSQPAALQQGALKLLQQKSENRWEKRLSGSQQLQEEEGADGQLPEEEDGRDAGAVGPLVDKLWNDLQQERVRTNPNPGPTLIPTTTMEPTPTPIRHHPPTPHPSSLPTTPQHRSPVQAVSPPLITVFHHLTFYAFPTARQLNKSVSIASSIHPISYCSARGHPAFVMQMMMHI